MGSFFFQQHNFHTFSIIRKLEGSVSRVSIFSHISLKKWVVFLPSSKAVGVSGGNALIEMLKQTKVEFSIHKLVCAEVKSQNKIEEYLDFVNKRWQSIINNTVLFLFLIIYILPGAVFVLIILKLYTMLKHSFLMSLGKQAAIYTIISNNNCTLDQNSCTVPNLGNLVRFNI
jgi:hypothetical protein